MEMEAIDKIDRPKCKLLISLPTLMFSVTSSVFAAQRKTAGNQSNIAGLGSDNW
jgi:hypothetical protein